MRSVKVWLVIGMIAALTGCSNGSSDSAADSCHETTTEAQSVHGAEAQAEATDGNEVWALFFNDWPLPPGRAVRIPVEKEVKIVWRSTGAGTFSIEADGPDGASIQPTWGPELHGGSNWERPGDEWGTGWIFPSTGCWTFHLTRDHMAAEMVAEVFSSSAPSTTGP